MMKESKISSLSSAELSELAPVVAAVRADMAQFDAAAEAMSDRETYELNEKLRKAYGWPPRSFEEFWGYKES
jgi:hypothetical protein